MLDTQCFQHVVFSSRLGSRVLIWTPYGDTHLADVFDADVAPRGGGTGKETGKMHIKVCSTGETIQLKI